jgi:hypothetical protein
LVGPNFSTKHQQQLDWCGPYVAIAAAGAVHVTLHSVWQGACMHTFYQTKHTKTQNKKVSLCMMVL